MKNNSALLLAWSFRSKYMLTILYWFIIELLIISIGNLHVMYGSLENRTNVCTKPFVRKLSRRKVLYEGFFCRMGEIIRFENVGNNITWCRSFVKVDILSTCKNGLEVSIEYALCCGTMWSVLWSFSEIIVVVSCLCNCLVILMIQTPVHDLCSWINKWIDN